MASTLLPLGYMKSRLVVTVAALIIGAGAGVMPSGAAERGADVARAQEALKQQGHDPGAIDGVYGPRTAAALKAYQQSQQLEATGQLDDATLARLGERASTTQSSSKTPTGGDRRPSPSDPAQGTKTGANVGEGAAYSRSTQK
jgi:peptidoglycan hydrolase-like protein with peptidoglycan-binding domain